MSTEATSDAPRGAGDDGTGEAAVAGSAPEPRAAGADRPTTSPATPSSAEESEARTSPAADSASASISDPAPASVFLPAPPSPTSSPSDRGGASSFYGPLGFGRRTPDARTLPVDRPGRRRLWLEIAIVLGLSLGASAVYSIVSIANRLTQDIPLGQQTATLNPSASPRPVFDLIYQVLGIGFDLVPVALVLYLLWAPGISPFRRLGFDLTRPARDVLTGAGLLLAIGIPGIGVYLGARALGLGVTINTSGLADYWWTVPVLILSAMRAALTEELIVVGFLMTRLRQIGWGAWPTIVASALLRGSYHLYQGFGGFVGNFAMGIVFGWLYTRYGRTAPLVVAHFFLDVASFLGLPLAVALFPTVFS